MARISNIQIRRGTAAQWIAANPILAAGEQAYETDTGIMKYGDGTTAYNSLTARVPTSQKTTRSATIVVAASDSSAASKAQADYVCDGTDDQVEINAAITTISPNGGRVLLLDGAFYPSADIAMASNIHLQGQGMKNTRIVVPAGTRINGIEMYEISFSKISDLEIDGNRANNTGIANSDGTQNCIHAVRISNCCIENCYLHDAIFHGIIMVHESNYNIIANNKCIGNGFRPIHSHTNCNHNEYYNNYCSDNGAADGSYGTVYGGMFVVYNGNSYNKIIGNRIINENAKAGMHINGGDPSNGNYATVGNMFIGNFIQTVDPGLIDGVIIGSTGTDKLIFNDNTIITGGHGITLESGALTNSVITGNHIVAARKGIYNAAGTSGTMNTISNNYINATGQETLYLTSISKSTITGNVLQAHSTWDGVALFSVSGCNISNNIINAVKYAINADANSTSNIFQNNKGSSLTTAPYYIFAGAGNAIKGNTSYYTEKTGTATITASATTVEVTHGLAAAPTRVLLSPTTATAGKQYYVSAKAATTFTITIDSAAEANISFDWQAVV